jgi:hypothetical protein
MFYSFKLNIHIYSVSLFEYRMARQYRSYTPYSVLPLKGLTQNHFNEASEVMSE